MFTRQFDLRVYAAAAVLAAAGLVGAAFGAYALWPSNLEAGYAPEQPIAFSHLTHAGTLRIDCLYCHSLSEKGPHATVPPVSTCMNCHIQVVPKDAQGRINTDVSRLIEIARKKESIAWVKVNDLADFAFFDHSRHMAAGLTCHECHGPVEKMERLRRAYGLKMSWCLECHRRAPPPGRPGAPDAPTQQASTTCTTCHR